MTSSLEESNQLIGHHCLKILRIRSFSGLYFLAFKLNTERYGVYRHFSRSASFINSATVLQVPLQCQVLIFTLSANYRVSREKEFPQFNVIQKESNNVTTYFSLVIISDTSLQSLGADRQSQMTGGPWIAEEQKDQINILELKAASLIILTFTRIHSE